MNACILVLSLLLYLTHLGGYAHGVIRIHQNDRESAKFSRINHVIEGRRLFSPGDSLDELAEQIVASFTKSSSADKARIQPPEKPDLPKNKEQLGKTESAERPVTAFTKVVPGKPDQTPTFFMHKNATIKPNFAKQQGVEEKTDDYLKFNKCRDSGEAYSAAYLIHKEHLLEQFTDYNLTWVNCEMGSFIMMNQRAHPAKSVNGSMTQSLDVLDFSVVHLSAYERLQRRWERSIPAGKMNVGDISPIQNAVPLLKERAMQEQKRRSAQTAHELTVLQKKMQRTVTIMPFLGYEMGAGHSNLGNRFVYLQACFWSLYRHYEHVTVAVKSEKDYEFAKKTSELPFFDVILMEGLPKSASLPVSTVKYTKKRMQSGGEWEGKFDYVYFTESDQILMQRVSSELYTLLDKFPRRLMIPHRLMPYPVPVLELFHKRTIPAKLDPFEWEKMNCCLERQNCWDRKTWKSVKDVDVPILQIFGIQVPLGNSNFHAESYRYCYLYPQGGVEVCP